MDIKKDVNTLIKELEKTRQLVQKLNKDLSTMGSVKATNEVMRQFFESEKELEFTVKLNLDDCSGRIKVVIDGRELSENEAGEFSIHEILRYAILKNLSKTE